MTRNTLDTILCNPHLPTLPTVALHVLELMRSPNINLQKIAQVIENDQALSLKVIRTVNSSFYGLARPCTTIRQAIVYLGLNTVKTLVLGFSLIESIEGGGEDHVDFDYIDYWQRSLYTAAAAREIAAIAGNLDPEEAFLAAMVLDIGMIAMHRTFGDMYLQVIDLTNRQHDALPECERQAFKTDHAEVGALVAERWKMPKQLVECIRHHHTLTDTSSDSKPMQQVLRLAALGAALSESATRRVAREQFDRIAREQFCFNRQQIRRLIEIMSESAKELAKLFRVKTGTMPTVDEMLAEAETHQILHQAQALRERETVSRQGMHNDADQPMLDPLTNLPPDGAFWSAVRHYYQLASMHGKRLALLVCREDQLCASYESDSAEDDATDAPLPNSPSSFVHLACSLEAWIEHAPEGAPSADGSSTPSLYRYNCDRFAILLPNAGHERAATLADNLQKWIDAERRASNRRVPRALTIGLGVAAYEPDSSLVISGPELLVGYADQALQAAQRAGRHQIRVFVPSRLNQEADCQGKAA